MHPRVARLTAPLLVALALVSALSVRAQLLGEGGLIEVVSIEIPTRVVDAKGRPVRDLTAKNFEVVEGREKHDIVRLDVIDLAQTAADGGPWSSAVPAAARRRFLFVFDLSFSSGPAIARAQAGVLEMLDGETHPSDLFGVARYSATRGVEMVLGLTSDLTQVREAVETLGAVDPAVGVNDPLRLMLVDLEAAQRADIGGAGSDGREPPGDELVADPLDESREVVLHLQDLFDEQSRTVRGEQARPILALASGLTGLAEHLASIPGYKQVLFLSEGFDDSFLTGTSDQDRVTRLSQATAISDSFQVDSDEIFGGGAVRSQLLAMAEAFERADCSIHAVDIGGLRAGVDASRAVEGGGAGAGSREAGLFLMASETGGRFVRGQNNLANAMAEVLAQTSLTYVLVVEPPNLQLDGNYHPVEVRIRRGPKGVEALHRPGYFAPLPYQGRKGEVRRLEAAELMATGDDGGPVATGVLAAAFPGEATAEVMAWVEMYGYGLLAGSPGERLPVEVYAYAFREDGTIADFATQVAMVDLRRHRRQIEAQGFKHVVRVQLSPGSYYLRVLVRNAITGATGLKTQRVDVPAFDAAAPRLSVPFFIEPEGLWVLGWGQAVANNTVEDYDYPLSYGRQRLVPSADPLLPRGVEVPMMLLGFDFAGAPVSLAAELDPVGGGDSLPLQVVLDDFEDGRDRASLWGRVLADGATPPGRYALRIRAATASGGVSTSPPIRVYVR